MLRIRLLTLTLCALLATLLAAPRFARAVDPHRSWNQLTTGNGFGFSTFDGGASRVNFFSNHPYVQRSPDEPTRDLAYDAYFGLRAAGGAAWLGERPVEQLAYRDQTHVIQATQSFGPLRAETYVFAPWGIEAPAAVLLLHVTNASRAMVTDGAAYALLNFHLGSGGAEPGANGEHITWDAATSSYSETGPSGVTLSYVPLGGATVLHGASPNNPYFIGRAGGDLVAVDDSGTADDAVAGFQWTFDALAPGAEQWVGVVVTTAPAAQARAWAAMREPQALLDAEVAAWNAWRVAPPGGLSPAETRVWRQSESVLRMAQSREPSPSRGQILAALPPGIWWIAWTRDMSYAVAALARAGHSAEAGLGVDFFQGAHVGDYRMYVGNQDYHVSVVRYYGNGAEWSDTDMNGPNVEFDGFGLSTWAARLAGRMDLDSNADTLRHLVDPTGMIAPDSSIWEVHWNGQQKHFAYTSIAAANALCRVGDATAARGIRDAMVRQMILPTGGLAGNLEELQGGRAARDAAVVEAINWGLIDPRGQLARATIQEFERLRTPVGRGYFRNDDGGGYDSQEWVYIDLRVASALRRMGRTAEADELLAWVTAQADANFGLQAELYHRETADYAGAVPMVGFGAGAYMLALLDRAQLEPLPEGCFPPETNVGSASGGDGGTGVVPQPRSACAVGRVGSAEGREFGGSAMTAVLGLLAVAAGVGRRRRRGARRERGAEWGGRALALLLALAAAACSPPPGSGDAGDAATDASRADAPPPISALPVRDCTNRFAYPLGHQASAVAVAGEWNMFSPTTDRLTDGLFSNVYRGAVRVAPGSYGYKFVADGQWALDPTNAMTAYVGGVENSRLIVPDCNLPLLRVEHYDVTADRVIALDIQYVDGAMRGGLDPASVQVTINRAPVPADQVMVDPTTARIAVRARVTENNKYTLRINAHDAGNRAARELIVPMWVEDQPFEWSDGPLYFAFTDRFRNGSTANDAMVDGVDRRANYQGGDFAGVTAALREGYFDRLGVRSIWLSPVNDNTDHAGRGSDGRMYSAYHGYWVTQPRDTEERFGSLDELRALIAEAHRHGIRVILDIANNQLHREHPYYAMYHDGFNGDGSCVCGGPNCDWDNHALECWFTDYLPDVNWTNMPMVDRMIDDALWWLTEVDADGFRVDAVKHMQHIASTTLRLRIQETLETGNTRYYLVGETFTGADGRGLVQSFIGPHELVGQFDFPLFWAIGGAFAQNGGTMGDLDNSVRQGEQTYQGAVMSPFLGNHDVERFISRASGQLSGNTMDQAWNDPPPPPDSDEPYDRLFLAFAFLLGQPGVPLIYYGDEIGMPGAADPDNRRMMRFGTDLSAREQHLLDRVRVIANARGTHPGLRRGERRTLLTDGDGYVFARGAGPNLAIVALNRGTTSRVVHVAVPPELAADGTVLRDLLGGPSVTITGGGFDMPFTPRNAALYVR